METAGACSKVPRLVSIPLDDSSSSITTSTAKSKKSKLAFIKQISCGSNHNFAVTDTNDVYSWGYGDLVALGNGKDQDEPIPKKLNLAKAKNISPDFKVSMVVGGVNIAPSLVLLHDSKCFTDHYFLQFSLDRT